MRTIVLAILLAVPLSGCLTTADLRTLNQELQSINYEQQQRQQRQHEIQQQIWLNQINRNRERNPNLPKVYVPKNPCPDRRPSDSCVVGM